MNAKITQIQTQKQILAPAMQQSISILMLPLADLNLAIEHELEANPLLEGEDKPREKENLIETDQIRKIREQENRQEFSSQWFHDDDEIPEHPIPREVSLEDSLLEQLRLEISDPLELKIGEFIIGNINEDGYLTVTLEEICEKCRLNDAALVEKVIKKIQQLEPLGIASRSLKECLKSQVQARFNGQSELALKIIDEHLDDLSQKKFHLIARKLKTPLEKITFVAEKIKHLEPRPARNHRPLHPHMYIRPDIIIERDPDNQYMVTINKESVPRLRINTTYQKMLNNPHIKKDERKFIQEKLKNAKTFIKSIDLRGYTMREIGKYILEKQKSFLEGKEFAIAPMTLKDVAYKINRNESTVSRAVHNKYIETPRGLFPLKFFFSQAVSAKNNAMLSSRSMKEQIAQLVAEEDKSSPRSDQEIQLHFEKKGIKLARRTVSKYRKDLKIPASHLRKE